jgi:hypothetical protein
MVVAHFYSWVILTDVVAIFLPEKRRHIYNIFRLPAAICFFYSTVVLYMHGLDANEWLLTLLRIGISVARLVHSIHIIWDYKTGFSHLVWAIPSDCSKIMQQERFLVSRFSFCIWLALLSAAMLLPHLLYIFHYNFGVCELDGVITGFQRKHGNHCATQTFHCCNVD